MVTCTEKAGPAEVLVEHRRARYGRPALASKHTYICVGVDVAVDVEGQVLPRRQTGSWRVEVIGEMLDALERLWFRDWHRLPLALGSGSSIHTASTQH